MTKHQPSFRCGNGAHHRCCCSNRHATGGGLHTCRNTHTPLDRQRQWRICECKLRTNLARMYKNDMRVKRADPGSDAGNDFNNNTTEGTSRNSPSTVISPEHVVQHPPRSPHRSSPKPSTSNAANNDPMESSGTPSRKHPTNQNTEHEEHVKKILLKTADIYASMNDQTLTEQDNIYSDVYQLYCTVYAENRRLKAEMRARGRSLSEESIRGSNSSASSSLSRTRLDGYGDGAGTVSGPVSKIEKLYKRTNNENCKMMKILSKKS